MSDQAFEMIGKFFVDVHYEERREEGKVRRIRRNPPSFHLGGPIPKNLLYKPENEKVLKLDLTPAVDIVHVALGRVRSLAKTKYDEHTGIRLIPKVLHACERRNIPQNFAPGILLMYVELCERCEWRDLLPRIHSEKRAEVDLHRELLAAGKNDEAKANVPDWQEYMVDQVADVLRAMRKWR